MNTRAEAVDSVPSTLSVGTPRIILLQRTSYKAFMKVVGLGSLAKYRVLG